MSPIFVEKNQNMRNRNFQKKNEKENQKGESKKKRETIFQDTEKTWTINVKKMSNKNKGNRQNRVFWEQKKTEKGSFAEVYKDTQNCQESIGYRKQRDNQKTQEKRAKFKRAEKGERTEKKTERQQIEHVDRGWRKEEMKS